MSIINFITVVLAVTVVVSPIVVYLVFKLFPDHNYDLSTLIARFHAEKLISNAGMVDSLRKRIDGYYELCSNRSLLDLLTPEEELTPAERQFLLSSVGTVNVGLVLSGADGQIVRLLFWNSDLRGSQKEKVRSMLKSHAVDYRIIDPEIKEDMLFDDHFADLIEVAQKALEEIEQSSTPSCPKCGSDMKERTFTRSGRPTVVYGCVEFPTCRGVLPRPAQAA